jgi:PhnB protein
MQFLPYLIFDDRCEEAFRFYAQALGAEIVHMQTHGESPGADEIPAEWHSRIIHARLVAGDAVLMGSDSPPEYYKPPQGMYVSIHPDDVASGERMFNALAAGGTVTMPFEETFWAERFGMLTDKFGIGWMVNCGEKAG